MRHIGSYQRTSNAVKANASSKASNKYANATLQIPSRPVPLYQTPEPFSTATKCNEDNCRLPDCFCGGTEIPGIFSHFAWSLFV